MLAEDLTARHKKTKLVTIAGAFFNFLLALMKCVAGWLGNSQALFADGIHSFADLLTDAVIIIASKFGNEAADTEHPYGHHRIETAGTICVALFLLLTAGTIIVNGLQHLFTPLHYAQIQHYVLWIALLGLLINEIIYHVTSHVAKKIGSDMLRAHAWHRRSDAAASLVVLFGVGGSMLGIPHLDAIAAIIVGGFIAKMAYQMGRKSFDELVDRGLNQDELQEIKITIESVPGVQALHQLRTRLMGGQICADVHIIVDCTLSVSEAHYIGDQVQTTLQKKFPKINDLIIHVDSENDELQHEAEQLPSRMQILASLEKSAHALPQYNCMQLKTIHYYKNHFTLELFFPLSCLSEHSKETLQESYQQQISNVWLNATIKVFLS